MVNGKKLNATYRQRCDIIVVGCLQFLGGCLIFSRVTGKGTILSHEISNTEKQLAVGTKDLVTTGIA